MKSAATTVPAYLRSLPADRRVEIERVRAVVNRNLDTDGYEEAMSYGMICWVVPHRVFPAGYHCNPKQALPFVALASQKNYCAVYVPLDVPGIVPKERHENGLHRWFMDEWKKSGKKLDMGKCCIRFKRADDLALDVLGELVRRLPAKVYIASYLAARDEQAQQGRKPRARAKSGVKAVIRSASPKLPRRSGKSAR